MIIHQASVNGVTCTCHELMCADGYSIVIDCGLSQGAQALGSDASFV